MTNTTTDAEMAALFGDPAIVKGKGFEIKRSDLDSVLTGAKANAAAAGQQLPPDFEIKILDQLVTIQLLLQKATEADRVAGGQEADTQMTNILKRFGSQAAFEHQLKAVGMTMEDLRAKATQEAVAKTALRRELNVVVSDADSKSYYDAHPAEFEEPERAHVRHILLLTVDPATQQPLPDDQIQAKRKQIEDLRKRALAGEEFTNLVAQYSEDPGSKDTGGEYTFARASADPSHAMVPEFEAAAFSLTNNQISDVVTTRYGFHIIKLLEKIPAKKYGYNEALPPDLKTTPADLCKTTLENNKIKELAPAYVDKLKKDYNVQILDPALKTLEATLEAVATNAPDASPDK
jgi:parvulin-like peptidyl-prolyl isomerase